MLLLLQKWHPGCKAHIILRLNDPHPPGGLLASERSASPSFPYGSLHCASI